VTQAVQSPMLRPVQVEQGEAQDAQVPLPSIGSNVNSGHTDEHTPSYSRVPLAQVLHEDVDADEHVAQGEVQGSHTPALSA